MLWEHGLTLSEFEEWGAFPDGQVLILWRQANTSSSEIFPIKKIEIVGTPLKLDETTSNEVIYRGKTLVSDWYNFSEPREISQEDIEINGGGYINISVMCKKANGEKSQWYPLRAFETQSNVTGIKIRADIGIQNFVNGTGLAGYLRSYLNSITFDRRSANGTYVGGNFTTRTLHLANIAKKVHATLVHREGLNVKAYVSLRSEGNFVSGESLGVGNGNRRSVTLQHTTGLTNGGFKLYFNGVEQAVSSYSFASGSGLVTFTAPSGVSVKCDYYYNTGAENFVEMTRTATYRNEDKPGMLESQFKYETTTGGNVATLKAEVAGDGRIEEMAVFFNQ